MNCFRVIAYFSALYFAAVSWAQSAKLQEINPEDSTESSSPLVLQPTSATPKIYLKSNKDWVSARWYVVGEFQKDSIRWLDGERSKIEWNSGCEPEKVNLASFSQVTRKEISKDSNYEVLRYAEFMAVELDPVKLKETFEVRAKVESAECQGSFVVTPKWSKRVSGPRPLFFIKPTGNFYYGKTIDVDYVRIAERADILIDLLAGYAQISLPNRDSGRKTPLHFLPLVTTRLEWMLPDQTRWGLQGTLDQSLYSFGGTANQNANISDWSIGGFYQRTERLFQGFVWRVHARLHDHLVDDFNILRSVAFENREAIYLPVGLSGQFLLGRRFSTGLEFMYAFPNNWAGRGGSQSYYMGLWRSFYRLNSVLLIIGELNYRSYAAEGIKAENMMGAQAGVRFEL